MKSIAQAIFRWTAVMCLAVTSLTRTACASNRMVAWGDITYDVTLTTDPGTGSGNGLMQISSGDYHSVALSSDGVVLAWGDNRFGQISVPDYLQLSPIAQVAAGNIHNLALTHQGVVVAAGDRRPDSPAITASAQSPRVWGASRRWRPAPFIAWP